MDKQMLLVIGGVFALLLVVVIIVVVVKKEKFVDEEKIYGNGHQYKKLGPWGGCQTCTTELTPEMMHLPELNKYKPLPSEASYHYPAQCMAACKHLSDPSIPSWQHRNCVAGCATRFSSCEFLDARGLLGNQTVAQCKEKELALDRALKPIGSVESYGIPEYVNQECIGACAHISNIWDNVDCTNKCGEAVQNCNGNVSCKVNQLTQFARS